MSKENVDLVRRGWEAAASKPPDWAVLNEVYHRDHELESEWGGINNALYRGAAGFRESLVDQDETWEEWRPELCEVIDAGGDCVVVKARLQTRGRHSAVPVDRLFGVLVSIRDGRIVRTRAFNTVEEALDAVGATE
jgi:ketosteroid isomerase-like protein